MIRTTHKHKPAANTAATFTVDAVPGVKKVLEHVSWSYTAAPTGGNLKIESPSGTVIHEQDITAAGPDSLNFANGLPGASGAAIVVTLAAGAGAVVGSVNGISRNSHM